MAEKNLPQRSSGTDLVLAKLGTARQALSEAKTMLPPEAGVAREQRLKLPRGSRADPRPVVRVRRSGVAVVAEDVRRTDKRAPALGAARTLPRVAADEAEAAHEPASFFRS